MLRNAALIAVDVTFPRLNSFFLLPREHWERAWRQDAALRMGVGSALGTQQESGCSEPQVMTSQGPVTWSGTFPGVWTCRQDLRKSGKGLPARVDRHCFSQPGGKGACRSSLLYRQETLLISKPLMGGALVPWGCHTEECRLGRFNSQNLQSQS